MRKEVVHCLAGVCLYSVDVFQDKELVDVGETRTR